MSLVTATYWQIQVHGAPYINKGFAFA